MIHEHSLNLMENFMATLATAPKQLPATGFIRQAELLDFVPFSKATLWRKCAAGDFPAPVKLSLRITGWRCEDVRAWMQSFGAAA